MKQPGVVVVTALLLTHHGRQLELQDISLYSLVGERGQRVSHGQRDWLRWKQLCHVSRHVACSPDRYLAYKQLTKLLNPFVRGPEVKRESATLITNTRITVISGSLNYCEASGDGSFRDPSSVCNAGK